ELYPEAGTTVSEWNFQSIDFDQQVFSSPQGSRSKYVFDEAYTGTVFAKHDIAQSAHHKISVGGNNRFPCTLPGLLRRLNQKTYAAFGFAVENADIDRTPRRSTWPIKREQELGRLSD